MDDTCIVRMLLRVSSKQQLDADGDLPAQRNIVRSYIEKQEDWRLDEIKPEYCELGVSGYNNSVSERSVLQEILEDARNHQFGILVCYKDDRLGRREDEIPAYIKELAENGVLVYTVREGCITPKNHIDKLLTQIRFWSAEGASMATAQRVKDAAMEQVRMGRNQGGNAPFGYRLELSGELSKHQRALKKKVVVPGEAELVQKIFHYALAYGYGAQKIAKKLNENPMDRELARSGSWKAGTISDMLKNPIYTGYEAYNRRTHEGKAFRRLNRKEWVLAEECNEKIRIIDLEDWERVQRIREDRKEYYCGKRKRNGRTPVSTTGRLPLIDVVYCGCCGRKLTNGSKYNYWTTKEGEKRSSIVGYYRCQARQQGENCGGKTAFRADRIEPEVYAVVREYLEKMEDHRMFLEKYQETQKKRCNSDREKIKKLKQKLRECQNNQSTYEEKLPQVLRGEISISVNDYYELIQKEKKKQEALSKEIEKLQLQIDGDTVRGGDISSFMETIPSWGEVFEEAEPSVKRMVINKLIERIDVWEDEIKISVKISREDILPRKNSGFPTTL